MSRPWDQRPGESDMAYTALLAYLRLGHRRTLRKAADDLGYDPDKRPYSLETWSGDYDWQERCVAYDRDPLARAVEELSQQRAEIEAKKLRAKARVQERLLDSVDELYDGLFKLATDEKKAAIAQIRAIEIGFEMMGIRDEEEVDDDAAQGAVVDYLLKLMDSLGPEKAAQLRDLIKAAQGEEGDHG